MTLILDKAPCRNTAKVEMGWRWALDFLSRAKILHCLQFGLGQEEEVGSSCDKKPPIQRAPLDKNSGLPPASPSLMG